MKCEVCGKETEGLLTNEFSIVPMCRNCYNEKIQELMKKRNPIFGGEEVGVKLLPDDVHFFYKGEEE